MTNERQHPDSAAETDKVVSDTYQQLSRESAPDHLNAKVLQQAASVAARPRYSRSMMWTRPLAWAATIALCLAIVLEVTRIPTPEIADIPESVETLEAEPAELKTQSPVQALTKQQPGTLADKKSQIGRAAAKQVADEPRRELQLMDAAHESEAGLNLVDESAASGEVIFEMRDVDMQPQSDELVRWKSEKNNQPAPKPGAFAVAMPALLASNECADDVRADPVTWMACIANLEESGDAEAALHEHEALTEAFPQFEMP